jgi:hypothetical protein
MLCISRAARVKLRLKNSSKRFKNAKTLTPKTVALKTAIGKSWQG